MLVPILGAKTTWLLLPGPILGLFGMMPLLRNRESAVSR